MSYQVDIEIEPKILGLSKAEVLKSYANMLSTLRLLGKAAEHSSAHYVEGVYYRWDKDDTKIKIYWGDDETNERKLCLEIVCFETDVTSIGNELALFLKQKGQDVVVKSY